MKKLHEEFHRLYFSSNIINVIKSRCIRLTVRIASMGVR